MEYKLTNNENFYISQGLNEITKINVTQILNVVEVYPLHLENGSESENNFDIATAEEGDLIKPDDLFVKTSSDNFTDLTKGEFDTKIDVGFIVFDRNVTKKIFLFKWEDSTHAEGNYNVIISEILTPTNKLRMKYDGIIFDKDLNILDIERNIIKKDGVPNETVPTTFNAVLHPNFYYEETSLAIKGSGSQPAYLHLYYDGLVPFNLFTNHELYPIKGKFKWSTTGSNKSLPSGVTEDTTVTLENDKIYEYTLFNGILSYKEVIK